MDTRFGRRVDQQVHCMRFAKRNELIGSSGIRDFFDMGRRVRDAVDLSIGQADFDVPEEVQEATIDAIRGQCGRYSVTQGYPDVVGATKRHLVDSFDLGEDEEVMLTSGTSGAITLAMLALAGPGDEVLLPDPYFVIYRSLARIVGATPIYYDLYPDFRLQIDEVRAQLTENTRLIVLNSPANPTGATLTEHEVEAIAALGAEHEIPVLSDELYARFTYDVPHVTIKRFQRRGTLLVGGFSKAYGMAGWRLGWAAGDTELIGCMRKLQQFVYTCPPTLVQRGGMAALHVDVSEQVKRYRRKRDLMYDGLVGAGYEVTRPTGSFFIYPQVPHGTDLEFCRRALEEKLIVVPGSAFSRRGTHFRISFATSDETLERGLEILARLAHG